MPELDPMISQKSPYDYGYNAIVSRNDAYQSDMDFGILRLKKGESYPIESPLEKAYLLMTGEVIFKFNQKEQKVFRTSYFDQNPYVLHLDAQSKAEIIALTDCEFTVMQTPNKQSFETVLFDENNMLESERRGKGLLNDVSYRIVRTVFDKRNRPEANLVVGEIITFSGHWSSTPPHFHKQPEIYYYRFSEPNGFAFGEDGDNVKRIKQNDTMVILDEKEHAHTTAPGYALYTLWFIRHLKDDPYIVPTFRKEHAWAKEANANIRVWKPLEDVK